MRHVCLWLLCTLAVAMIACGGGASTSNNVAGNWTANLNDSKGATFVQFSALLTQGSSYQIGVTNLTFAVASTCFGKGTTASSTFGVSGTMNAADPNAFQLTLQSSQSNTNGVNLLVLQGMLSQNSISGTWTGTGSGTGCADTGAFTMSRD